MTAAPASTAPLDGILVADFSRVLAGPLASMTLADLGARVVKVERPGTGDDTRAWGPPWSPHAATYFEGVNRNKESVALDLKDPADLDRAKRLAQRADVVIENFLPGTLDRVGLGYDDVARENPGVVYVSITGFGSAGGAQLPGYDFVVQAIGGLMHITGAPDGDPMKVGVAVVDVLTGKDAVIGVLAALRRREATGEGSRIEVSLLSSLQGALANQAAAHLGAGASPTRMGNMHPSIAPYELLQCADGPLAIACGNDAQFRKLTEALGIPGAAQDERFRTNADRVAHRPALRDALETALAAATAAEWQERLTAIGVPAGQASDIASGLEFAERLGLEPTIEVHGADGASHGRQVRHPVLWDPPFEAPRRAAPALDEQGDAIRSWLDS
ncbi:CoA transferase [Microbacterium paludicola]|uniref:CoA transferase n=1 Tax=Microbacterium paludicola TaxID=300019 RepID=A0A4Y9FXC5_9MICO|nr:CoA transferase [Microbacterium paludicola]MBF0816073.1 CoA transferase [Microbacterium paludicola]TFU33258.1 CoA transferase [Microbacterium paludicola]